MHVIDLSAEQTARLKPTYITRNVVLSEPISLVGNAVPRRGDLAIARVTEVGHHTWVDGPGGRRTAIYPQDLLLVAYGARYAPDQFEAELPDDLGPADLAAKGGMIGKVRSRHATTSAPTQLEPLGLLADASGRVRNLSETAMPLPASVPLGVPTIAVVGTSMNAGKTTAVASLIHGLTMSGVRVGAAKLTGTGAGGDPDLFRDAGARRVLDFTDMGHPSTFRVPFRNLVRSAATLHGQLADSGVDAIVLEVADGLLLSETANLVQDRVLRGLVNAYVFAAGDAAGALFGVGRLRDWGLNVIAASGVFTQSPLAMREAAMELDVPVYTPGDLASASIAKSLLDRSLVTDAAEASLVGRAPARRTRSRKPAALKASH